MREKRTLAVVIDDEPMIRLLVADMLCDAGYEVIEACDAHEALETLKDSADGVALLFTDVDMPGTMNGLKLAHHTHTHWPWIGVLITSGKAALGVTDMPDGARFLPKPFTPADVLSNARDLVSVA